MTTDGGGWTLALNYLHKGGTDPALVPFTDRLPLRSGDVVGPDESMHADRWGHAGNTLFTALDVDEMRFVGVTAAHNRRLDFVSWDPICIAYFGMGAGISVNCSGLANKHRTLPGHTAMTPAEMTSYYEDQGDYAMTNFPFYLSGIHHWGVRGSGSRWEVDDSAGGAQFSTMHRIWVRAAPDHCESGVADGDEEGVDCGGSCAVACDPVDAGEACTEHPQCVTGVCQNNVCEPAADCLAILTAQPEAQSGDFLIDPDGEGGLDPFYASCDMVTDGGGWTLVLGYLKLHMTDPELVVMDAGLPRKGGNILGGDESGTPMWGHANNAMFALMGATEARFYGRTSHQGRDLHFTTVQPSCLDYLSTGLGSCSGLTGSFRALAGHSTYLPWAATNFQPDNGDNAMTSHTFYTGGLYHWNVNYGTRWEVDDYEQSGQPANSTLHRVWVRSCPVLMHDGFEDGDSSGWTFIDQAGANGGPSNWAVGTPGFNNQPSQSLVETSNINGLPQGYDNFYRRGTVAIWDDPIAYTWQDYRMTARLASNDDDGLGVVFRYTDEDNYYKLEVDNQNNPSTRRFRRLVKVVDGVETLLAANDVTGYAEDHWFPVEIEVRGSRIHVYIDGWEQFGGPIYDDALSTGTVGFYNWGSAGGFFDDMVVMEACP